VGLGNNSGQAPAVVKPLARILGDWLYGIKWEQWPTDPAVLAAPPTAATLRPPWDPLRLMTILLRRDLRIASVGPVVVVPPDALRGVEFGEHVRFHLLWQRGDEPLTMVRRFAAAFEAAAPRRAAPPAASPARKAD